MWSLTVWSGCLFGCWEHFQTGARFGNHVCFAVKMKRRQGDETGLFFPPSFLKYICCTCTWQRFAAPRLPSLRASVFICNSLKASLMLLWTIFAGGRCVWCPKSYLTIGTRLCWELGRHHSDVSSTRSFLLFDISTSCMCVINCVSRRWSPASFLLQCVCGRWMWRCPRAASRWPVAKQLSCPAPSPPALPSTTSTSSGWWYRCPMPTSQNRYGVHRFRDRASLWLL